MSEEKKLSDAEELIRFVGETHNPKILFYLALYRAVRAQVHSDEVALFITDQVGREIRGERVSDEKKAEHELKKLTATEKQRGKLRFLGLDKHANDPTLSKVEASRLIDSQEKKQ